VRDSFPLQLYFGASLSDESLAELLGDRRQRHQARLNELRHLSAGLADEGAASSSRAAVLRQTALDGAIARELSAIDWLDDCIDAIAHGTLPGSTGQGIGQRHLFGS
jgi:hypothetical protein